MRRTYLVSTYEGMRLCGLHEAKAGQVMLRESTSATGLGVKKRWHWSFHRRRGESRSASKWVTRAGELDGARVLETDGRPVLIQFYLKGQPKDAGLPGPATIIA